jgi:uncharacterized membrane protein YfcA
LILLAVVVGAVTGVLSGMGIGGGTLLVIYLVNIAHVPQLEAQGINLVYFLPVAALSLISHIKNKLVVRRAFVFSGLAGVIFTVAGSLVATSLNTGVLRKLFGLLLIAAGMSQIFKKDREKGE